MPRSKRTFASSSGCRRNAGRSNTPTRRRRRSAPHTFETRINAEALTRRATPPHRRDQWNASDEDPKEHITFGAYSQRWLANRQVAGRPLKARTRAHYEAILDRTWCRRSGRGSSAPSSRRTSAPGTRRR